MSSDLAKARTRRFCCPHRWFSLLLSFLLSVAFTWAIFLLQLLLVCAFRILGVSKGFLFLLAFFSRYLECLKLPHTNSTRDFLADFFQCRACAVELFNSGRYRIYLVSFLDIHRLLCFHSRSLIRCNFETALGVLIDRRLLLIVSFCCFLVRNYYIGIL